MGLKVLRLNSTPRQLCKTHSNNPGASVCTEYTVVCVAEDYAGLGSRSLARLIQPDLPFATVFALGMEAVR